jgi:alanine racemase
MKVSSTVRSYNQVNISPKALRNNFKIIQKKAGVRVLAMVKADGYGHDMVRSAEVFAAAGCETFGVAEIDEAVTLRKAGIRGEIFIMLGFMHEHVDLVLQYNLTPVVFRIETAECLSDAAVKAGRKIGIHLKVDSGMSRLGLLPDQVDAFLERMCSLPSLYLGGIVSHFSQSDDLDSENTGKSYSIYTAMCNRINARCDGIRHIANSGGVFNFPGTCGDMVRPGISLYGYYPDGEEGMRRARGEKLIPAMSFTTQVLQVKTVPAGAGVSYGHTYITPSEARLAILPVGYEDGYLRSLSNRGEVLIKGRRAPLRGRICMNMCMADISAIEGVRPGDEVVLMGRQGQESITADEIAAWAGTISYEVLCLIGNNNERTYIKEEI